MICHGEKRSVGRFKGMRERFRIYVRTELPVQLSQPQGTWCTWISVGESPNPKENDEKDLVWDERAPVQDWGKRLIPECVSRKDLDDPGNGQSCSAVGRGCGGHRRYKDHRRQRLCM